MEEHLNVRYRLVDITDHDAVSGLIEASDVVIRCVYSRNQDMLFTDSSQPSSG